MDDLSARLQQDDRRALEEWLARARLALPEELLRDALCGGQRPRHVIGLIGTNAETVAKALADHLESTRRTALLTFGDRDEIESITGGARDVSVRWNFPRSGLRVFEAILALLAYAEFDVVLLVSPASPEDILLLQRAADRLIAVVTPETELTLLPLERLTAADIVAVYPAELPGGDVLLALLRECLGEMPVVAILNRSERGIARLRERVVRDED